jgi:uncharacterized protein YbjT (DUF2867 family)
VDVVVFGATGMIGQGVLRECLHDRDVARVLAVGRNPSGQRHEKLSELVTRDLMDLASHSAKLTGYDACFFCLGATSVGMNEEQYTRLTYDLTLAVARTLFALNPSLTFVFVSGLGTDEHGRAMWARVKGRTENALLGMSDRAYMVRPAFIIPKHGIRSRTPLYNLFYGVAAPLSPVLRRLFPRWVTTTEQLGRAMIQVARSGAPKRVLETPDLVALSS